MITLVQYRSKWYRCSPQMTVITHRVINQFDTVIEIDGADCTNIIKNRYTGVTGTNVPMSDLLKMKFWISDGTFDDLPEFRIEDNHLAMPLDLEQCNDGSLVAKPFTKIRN